MCVLKVIVPGKCHVSRCLMGMGGGHIKGMAKTDADGDENRDDQEFGKMVQRLVHGHMIHEKR